MSLSSGYAHSGRNLRSRGIAWKFMKSRCTLAALLLSLSTGCLFATDDSLGLTKPDPQLAGMSAKHLEAIPARMKEYVDSGKAAGMVTVVAHHGHVASFEAVGYQDLEKK